MATTVDKIIVEYQADVKKLNAGIDQINKKQDELLKKNTRNTKAIQKNNTGLGKSFKQLGSVIAGAFAFTAIIAGLQKIITLNAELSDSIADVRKTTGLSKEAVDALVTSLQKLDTRTSLKGLLEISKIGGQIGVAKDEILGFTEAIDKAVVALGDEFGGGAEQVATVLGKIESVFNISKDSGEALGISLTKVGSSINALGAAGLATAPFLTDFTQRLGGVAVNAGITVNEILGLGAAAEQSGLRVESSSTAISSLLQKFSTDTAKFAQLAQVDVGEFTDLVNNDLNKALLLFLEGAKGSAEDTVTFAKNLQALGLEGAEVTKVVATLSGKTDLIREKQALANDEFEKGTSLLEEFNLKNNTLAANIDKLFKKISGGVTDSAFADFLNDIVIGILDLIEASDPVIEVFSELFGLIGDLAGEFSALLEELGLVDEETDKTAGAMSGFATILKFSSIPLRLMIKGLTLLVQGLRFVKDGLIPVVDGIVSFTKATKNLLDKGLSLLGIGAKEAADAQKEVTTETKKATDAINADTDASKENEEQKKRTFKTVRILTDKEQAALKRLAKQKARAVEKEIADAKRLAEIKLKIQEELTKLSLQAIEGETERKLALADFAFEQEIAKLRKQLNDKLITETEFSKAKEDQTILFARETDAILDADAATRQEVETEKAEIKADEEQSLARRNEEALLAIKQTGAQLVTNLLSIIFGKRTKAAKALALFEIGINQAVAISELVKDVQKVGLTPFEKIAIFAAGLTQITAGIVQAKNILSANPEPEGFYKGGLVGGGERQITVNEKGKEYVVPNKPTEKYFKHLEAMKGGRYEEYMRNEGLSQLLDGVSSNKRKHEDSFANNLSKYFGQSNNFDDTQMVHAIRTGTGQSKRNTKVLAEAMEKGQRERLRDYRRSY